MNKKTITLVMMLLLAVTGVKADVIPSRYYSTVGQGEFYLYNVDEGQFLTATPSLSNTPVTLTITSVEGEAGKYYIKPTNTTYLKMGHWHGTYLWNNNLPDAGNDYERDIAFFKWSFALVNSNVYCLGITPTIEKTDDNYTFTTTNTYYLNTVNTTYALSTNDANKWALITADNYSAYQATLDPAYVNKQTIINAKGDATSLISNPTFDSSDEGWTGGARTNCNTWRGNNGYDYESTSDNVTFSQTLNDMPAGTYKLVAAVRGDNGTTATAQINGASGTTITNGAFDTSRQQINLNGVQMPYSSIGGFNTGTNALGWQWATATYTLAADGSLTISFVMTGAKWKGIDDVHLYYMNDGTTTYAVSYSDGVNNDSHIVTCDLQTDNPNKVFRASSNIYTASGDIANNLRINSTGWINKLVLYDGYDFSIPSGTRSVNSTLFRNVAAGVFATICCPFAITGGADGTFYQPESLSGEGVLNFASVASPEGGKAYLYKASSAVTALTHAGDHWLAENITSNGTGVNMIGTYTNIETVNYNDYVLSGTNLYKVDSDVSLAPFRAYFTIPASGAPARINLSFDDDAAAIQAVEAGRGMDGAYYNMAGQRVAAPTKGLYIVNGKKVLIK